MLRLGLGGKFGDDRANLVCQFCVFPRMYGR